MAMTDLIQAVCNMGRQGANRPHTTRYLFEPIWRKRQRALIAALERKFPDHKVLNESMTERGLEVNVVLIGRREDTHGKLLFIWKAGFGKLDVELYELPIWKTPTIPPSVEERLIQRLSLPWRSPLHGFLDKLFAEEQPVRPEQSIGS